MDISTLTDRPVVKTVVRNLAYLGARAKVTTIHHDKSRVGLRTVIMEWLDDATIENGGHPAGTITRKVISGDAWRGEGRTAFVEVEAETVIS